MKKLLTLAFTFTLTASLFAEVVHPAADFTFPGIGNRNASLRGLRGQAVVLVMTDKPEARAFKKQLRNLEDIYQQFASKQVIFVAALRSGEGPIKTDIPFSIANNGAAVATAYGFERGFAIAIIGKDGNVDYQTTKVCTGERVRDVVQNSFAVQSPARK